MWRRLFPVLSLFFLSPLIAEWLLGSLPMSLIGILPLMALMYGAGAILIREWVRRTGRGWPSILLLATAYGLIEEGLVTQSLFNPNYLHLRLLDFGFIPALGTGLPWAIFVITIHVLWSISVPIGLTEGLFKGQRETPWLGRIGLGVVTILYIIGCALFCYFSYHQMPFMAEPVQFVTIAALVIALVVAAFLLPRGMQPASGKAPHPVILFLASLGGGSALMLIQRLGQSHWHWSWQTCVAAVLALEVALIVFMVAFTRNRTWTDVQRYALMAGGLLVYVWVGFPTDADLHGVAGLPAHTAIAAAFVLLGGWAGFMALKEKR